MALHPNAEFMQRTMAAVASGDIPTFLAAMSDDIAWHMPGDNQLAGAYHGKDEFRRLMTKIRDLSGGTFKMAVHDITASDDHAVNIERVTASRDGRQLDIVVALVLRIKDGKITEVWEHFFDFKAWDDFWS